MRLRSAVVRAHRGAASRVRAGAAIAAERAGALLTVVDLDGRIGQGEASPLPGYSHDGLGETERALSGIDWTTVPEIDGDEPAPAYLVRVAAALSLPSAARFAVETALLDLCGQRRARPLWALLVEAAPVRPVPVSAMAGGADDPRIVEAARAAVARGITTVKVKITGPSLGAQGATLSAVQDALGGERLRLDANGSFLADGVVNTLRELATLSPELVEEPAPPNVVLSLAESPVPLALDESLQDPATLPAFAPRVAALGVRAVVLKPTTLGGLSGCLALARAATSMGLDVTVSHAFEGPVGLRAAMHLALAVASRTRASGLDGHGGLEAWPRLEIPGLGAPELAPDDRPGLGLPPLEELG